MSRLEHGARVFEFIVASILTLALVVLHFSVFQHAGPLWRDEISSFNLATEPTLAQFWANLTYDPVPALFFCLLRGWHFLGAGATDQDLRILGLVIGLALVGAVWVASFILKKSPPTWALLIFGLSPVTLVWGDSLRAYGLSCVFNILTIALLWRLLTPQPRWSAIALAALAAVLSVQSLFPNALLLFAAGLSGIAIALGQRWWRSALALAGIGLAAALSLIPYWPTVRRTQEWSMICNTGAKFDWITTMLYRALSSGGQVFLYCWLGLGLALLGVLALALIRPTLLQLADSDRRLVFYLGATLLIASGVIITFFCVVGWTTSLWYYLPLMGTAAICLDAAAGAWQKNAFVRSGSAVLLTAAAVAVAPLVWQASGVRLTNVDLVAQAIAREAQPEDLVIVDNFFYSVSFHRYYHGRAQCLSSPGVDDLSLHRWDLLKDRMTEAEPIKPILDRIEQTLRSGHSVYVAGFAPPNRASAPPPDLPPAPHSSWGWCASPYIVRWTMQIAYAVQVHAERGGFVPVSCAQPVSEAERVRAFSVSGWKDENVAKAP